MKKVIVYVEGQSDKASMQALLKRLIEQKRQNGIEVRFFDSLKGDRKTALLTTVPERAANIILNDPNAVVVAMPDLYPKNKSFTHTTFEELRDGIIRNFESALRRKRSDVSSVTKDRFKVFCFKYDLEALILASEHALKQRLGIGSLKVTWQVPVEDQNHDSPPKRIVERLFKENGSKYVGTSDAPIILGQSDYMEIAEKCPQCFKPFVEFLTAS